MIARADGEDFDMAVLWPSRDAIYRKSCDIVDEEPVSYVEKKVAEGAEVQADDESHYARDYETPGKFLS